MNNRDLKIWVVGQTGSFKLVPFESLGVVHYSPSTIVTVAVSLTVYDIFSVNLTRDRENWVGGCSRSLKMAPFNRPYTTFCWSAIANIYSNCTVLSYLMLNNIVTLKSGLAVRYSMSFKLVPFDSKAWVQFPIRFPTMALSCIISETKRDNGRKS